ncbi:MAG: excisionase family DNA-binding protein [Burkholderiaceae bacterium]|nr:excisionase family DNA-binding protein [Burkholderiaceae bacterium]
MEETSRAVFDARLSDPDRNPIGIMHAIDRARARKDGKVSPDDLFVGMLLAVSRRGKVRIGALEIDLRAVDLPTQLGTPLSPDPRFTPEATEVMKLAASLAYGDDRARLAPIHFLEAIGDLRPLLFSSLCDRLDIDRLNWRVALADVRRSQAGVRPVEWLSVTECARRLGIEESGVHGLIEAGELPAMRVCRDRVIRVRRDDVEALAASTSLRKPRDLAEG